MYKENFEKRAEAMKRSGTLRAVSFAIMFLVLAASLVGIGAVLFKNTPLDEIGRGSADVEVAAITGNGSSSNPWTISTKADLQAWASSSSYWSGYTQLAADIDWGGSSGGNYPVVSGATCQFDGNNHVIRNLYMNRSSFAGFFVQPGTGLKVMNLGLVEINFTSSTDNSGGIVGRGNSNTFTLERCFTTGVLNSSSRGAGGLIGSHNQSSGGTVIECFSTVNIKSGNYSGGLAGQMYSGDISNSYFTGTMNLTESSYSAGICGTTTSESVQVKMNNVYTAGTYSGSGTIYGLKYSSSNLNLSFSLNTKQSTYNSNTHSRTMEQMTDNLTMTDASGMTGLNTNAGNGKWIKRPNENNDDKSKQYYPELKCFAESPNMAIREYSKASVRASGYVDPGYNPNSAPEYTNPGNIDLGYMGQPATLIDNNFIKAKDINNPARTFSWTDLTVVSGGFKK